MGKAAVRRSILISVLATACTAGSVALPPAQGLGSCPDVRAQASPSSPALPAGTVPATVWRRQSDSHELVAVDALSLAERGRAVEIGSQQRTWRRIASPDGDLLAVGGLSGYVEIIDVARGRKVSRVLVDRVPAFLDWPHRERITVATKTSAAIIDPTAGEIVARTGLSGEFIAAAASEGALAVLSAVPSRLKVLKASGETVTVPLEQIDSRYGETPAVVVDPKGNRVLVFGLDGLVADISVDDRSVSYAPLARSSRSLTLPAAVAKPGHSSELFARWLPNGLVAVFGRDVRLVQRGPNRFDPRSYPRGVVLFDPDERRACMLDARSDAALVADGTLLAFREVASDSDEGLGVAAYTINGEKMWHRLGNDAIDFVQVLNGHVYVTKSWRGWETVVLELATGEVIEEIKGRPPDLVGAHSSRPGVGGHANWS